MLQGEKIIDLVQVQGTWINKVHKVNRQLTGSILNRYRKLRYRADRFIGKNTQINVAGREMYLRSRGTAYLDKQGTDGFRPDMV